MTSKTPVCVLGTGLIGGSVLRAAVAAGYRAWGYDRAEATAQAATAQGFTVRTDIAGTLRRAAELQALLVVAVPMPAVAALLSEIAPTAARCPLTDVVSVKSPVAQAVRAHGLSGQYVGGHPMAGRTESGWAASRADLFHGAAWVVSVDDDVPAQPWWQVAQLALDCGAVVAPLTSADHDQAVARVSHLPHLMAAYLAIIAERAGDRALALAAGSFRDATRVAGTDVDLLRAICEPNATHLGNAVEELAQLATETVAQLAENASLAELFTRGYQAHQHYQQLERPEITNIRPGEANWIQQLRERGRLGHIVRSLS